VAAVRAGLILVAEGRHLSPQMTVLVQTAYLGAR
jgi:hypothetical protein